MIDITATRQPRLRRLTGLLCAGLLLAPLTANAEWLRDEQAIMGTQVSVEVNHAQRATAQRGIDAVMAEMRRIDAKMSPHKPDSELSQVNKYASDRPVKVSQELMIVLNRSVNFSKMTNGTFDVTFASAGFLYDFHNHLKPKPGELQKAVDVIDYRQMVLDNRANTVKFNKPGMKIDLGGIGKGYAVDRSINILKQLGIQDALVTAGGDTRVIGERWGRPWNIGVRDPRDAKKQVAMIPLENVAVSTSGDYERFFEENGVRYHHIIDPKTGDSARKVQSVTIIGDEATTTDALSTSVFILGVRNGLTMINALPKVDAVIVDNEGKLHYTNGLLQRRAGYAAPKQANAKF
jgi:thiamine biosynthesis lipoprotein